MFNKSQTKALAKLKKVSESEFKRIANPEPSSEKVEPQHRAHSHHLEEMPRLAFLLNTDLKCGFTVAQVAGKQG